MPKLALPKMNLYYKKKMKRKKGIDPTDCPFCGHLVIFNRFVEIINENFSIQMFKYDFKFYYKTGK